MQTLVKWLERQIAFRGCSSIEVKHLTSRSAIVFQEDIPDEIPENDIQVLADEIEQACQNDADGIGSLQKYAVFAKRRDGKENGRYILKYKPLADDDVGGTGFDDDGSLKSIVSQQMRHNEALMRTSTMSMGQTMQHLFTIIEEGRKREQLYAEKHFAVLRLYEELLSKKHERVQEAKEQEFRHEIAMETLDQVKPFLPLIAQKLLSGDGAQVDMGNAAIRGFLSSMSPEQLEQLWAMLTPAQMELVKSMIDNVDPDGKDAH